MEKILLCRTDGIGDLLLITPLIREIKKIGNFVAVLTSRNSKDILLNNPDVDAIFVYPSSDLKEKIVLEKFDRAYIIYPRFSIALLMLLSNIKYRVGTAYRWYSFLFNKRIKIHRKFNEMHEADYNLKLAEDIIGRKTANKLYLYLNKNEVEFAQKYLEQKGITSDFFIVYPCGSGSAKNLPPIKYAELIDVIKQKFPEINILVASGKNEQNKVYDVYNNLKNKKGVYIMDENLSIRELSSIISKAKIFISGSTGPMHIAAALDIKTLTFFPNRGVYPIRWGAIGNISDIIKFESYNSDFINFTYIIEKLQILLKREK